MSENLGLVVAAGVTAGDVVADGDAPDAAPQNRGTS